MFRSSDSTLLEITRPKAFVSMLIPCKVVVDGEKIGDVRNGETITFEVSTGSHIICVKQGLMARSNVLALDCSPDQTIRLQMTQNSLVRQLVRGFAGKRLSRVVDIKLERLP